MKLSASITIPRSVNDVFRFVSDVANMPKWVSGVSKARLVSPEMDLGARFVCEYTSTWRSDPIELEVVAYEPPRLIGTRSSRGPFQFEGRVFLEDADGQTVVTNTTEAGPDSLSTRFAGLLLGPFLRRSMRKRLLRELTALEKAITGGKPSVA
jgi:uncharacterized protein YndB with AHSA1/START domain